MKKEFLIEFKKQVERYDNVSRYFEVHELKKIDGTWWFRNAIHDPIFSQYRKSKDGRCIILGGWNYSGQGLLEDILIDTYGLKNITTYYDRQYLK